MKSNLLTLIVIALFYGNTLSGQTEFMPVGAKWITEASSFWGYGGFITFHVKKDTICGKVPCKQVVESGKRRSDGVEVEGPFRYIIQKGDSIFYLSTPSSKPYFLYKNHYAVGDSIVFPTNPNINATTVYIDSVIVQNGVTRYASRMVYFSSSSVKYVQKRFNMYDKFFPDLHWDITYIYQMGFWDGSYYTPLCYTDRSTFYNTPNESRFPSPCDSLKKSSPNLNLDEALTIFPNPANQIVFMRSKPSQSVTVNIYDMRGVEYLQKKLTTPNYLDVATFPNGMYIVKIVEENGAIQTKKMVIQH